MPSPTPLSSCDLADCLLDLSEFGTVTLPAEAAELTFQIDIIPSECPDQVFFGLVHLDSVGQQPVTGFAIHLDWTSGHVRDAINGFGILDTLDLSPTSFGKIDEEEPLSLCLKIEKRGTNLLPTFEIGGQRLLYPSLSSSTHPTFTAVAGAAQPGRDTAPFCLYPALWMVSKA